MFPIVTLTITWILVIARFVIAIQLTRVGRRNKLPNLLWLASFFYVTGIGDIFITLSPVTNFIWPFFVAVGLGEVLMVMFIHKTFYQDRKSPYLIFMAIALVVLVVNILIVNGVIPLFLPIYSPFNWLWLIWVAYQSYKKIAPDPVVEDWVKSRYKLVIAYSLAALVAPLYTILTLLTFLIPAMAAWLFTPVGILIAQVGILVFVTIGIVLEYLAWVMPARFRHYLNRNYQAPLLDNSELELSEEEIMRRAQDQT